MDSHGKKRWPTGSSWRQEQRNQFSPISRIRLLCARTSEAVPIPTGFSYSRASSSWILTGTRRARPSLIAASLTKCSDYPSGRHGRRNTMPRAASLETQARSQTIEPHKRRRSLCSQPLCQFFTALISRTSCFPAEALFLFFTVAVRSLHASNPLRRSTSVPNVLH
jgi:hypothetical protein